MGQRSQIILISEGVKYGGNNPNNNNGRLYISHNQWRYGTNAIYVLRHLLEKYKHLITQDINKGEFFFSKIDGIFGSCLRYAENKDLKDTLSQSHSFRDTTKEFYEFNKVNVDFLGFLNHYTDNNNGWFIIKVNRDRTIELAVINGCEESDKIKGRTFKEYCKMFGELDKEEDDNIKELEKYSPFDFEKESKKFFNQIKEDFDEVKK